MNLPTPRTEAVMVDPLSDGNDLPHLARKLEIELSEALRERDKLKQLLFADAKNVDAYLGVCIERDEARGLLRILADLVAYGLGQSGEDWSLEAMRQATTTIQNAKSLEGAK